VTADRKAWSRKRRPAASILLGLVTLLSLGATWVAASNGIGAAQAWIHEIFHDPDGCGGG
jgi:hypothetical protein